MLIKEITALIRKDLIIEWRQKYAINGIILYLASAIFIVYLGFQVNHGIVTPEVWITLFWIIILFTAVNAVAKSFILEKEERTLYFYNIASPEAIILSKIIYNSMLMIVLGALGLLFYSIVFQNEVVDQALFLITLLLGAIGFAIIFTMISGIASKASNGGALMAILGFPVMLPMLLVMIRLSTKALSGMQEQVTDDLLILAALNMLTLATAYILFPYIWRS
jgi:heme exporter protein B